MISKRQSRAYWDTIPALKSAQGRYQANNTREANHRITLNLQHGIQCILMNHSWCRVIKNMAILCSRLHGNYHKHNIRQQNSLSLGAAPLDSVVPIVFLHDCMCTSSLVLLSALRIAHLRLLAFHQHCSEHCTTAALVLWLIFVFFLQRKCKTVAACEGLKAPHPTPALTVNSLHANATQVSFITCSPIWNMFTPKSLFRGRQYSLYSHSI